MWEVPNNVSESLRFFFQENKIESCQILHQGLDIENKVKVVCRDGSAYFLKTSGNSKFTIQTYDFLKKMSDCVISPLGIFDNKDQRMILQYPWIEGKTLHELVQKAENLLKYAEASAKLLKSFHSNSVGCCNIDALDIEEEFHKTNEIITQNNILIPHLKHWNEYFMKCLNKEFCAKKIRKKCVIHGDFKSENIMLCQDGKLRLVDVENVKYSDPWNEFMNFTMLMSDSREEYSYIVMKRYFDDSIPKPFLDYISVICVLQLYKLAIWNHNHHNIQNTFVQENYLYQNFNFEMQQANTWIHNRLKIDSDNDYM